jgi:hypothetical protein
MGRFPMVTFISLFRAVIDIEGMRQVYKLVMAVEPAGGRFRPSSCKGREDSWTSEAIAASWTDDLEISDCLAIAEG